MKTKINRIHFNWRQEGNIHEGLGENYEFHEVGINGVTEIKHIIDEGPPFYIVYFATGKREFIYNFNQVFCVSESEEK